ncbi:MAG: ribonucleoside-triphosphate reductase, adenosylcobalamin-dependent, partial [Dolichospermum sp.]
RWLWVGGTEWSLKKENYPGAYNCTSTDLVTWDSFATIMNLAMMGCGTGAVIEPRCIEKLPIIKNCLNVYCPSQPGEAPTNERKECTEKFIDGNNVLIRVGDSRQGWVDSYLFLLQLASDDTFTDAINVTIDLSHVRKSGEPLKGFGGVANPVKLMDMYKRVSVILNKAIGRQLTSVECCLVIDEAAICVVAGNIRRSAGIRQFISSDGEAATVKDNLWQQVDGSWQIDPERDALRMANHTRVFHRKPTLEDCINSVTKQYYSGEGAIQWAGEAVARANADIISQESKISFLAAYQEGQARDWILKRYPNISDKELDHRLNRYGLNPCGEIIGNNFFCNLSEVHLNQLDPYNYQEQVEAFTAGALSVAALLHHDFIDPVQQYSREIDPIVGVSFTGLFDFFVNAFGVNWLRWWEQGRPNTYEGMVYKHEESKYLKRWKEIVHEVTWGYCDKHGLKRPNRCTTVQPAGSKSLLTGASSGWHPPKAQRFIRRITFRKNDPVALACIDYGYNVVPSQSDKDEKGRLLDDPFDIRCTEWLVEIPVAVAWANSPGADKIDLSKLSALAQLDFLMQVQKHYTTHNTSSTVELRSDEIESLAYKIYLHILKDEGYISAALLARFDDNQTFPRLPFEPIDKDTYDRLSSEVRSRRKTDDFYKLLRRYDLGEMLEAGPAGCDSDKCLFPV